MKFEKPIIDSGAIISDDQTHRYSLWRIWNKELPRILFIGLNPSRADQSFNDPTITRCISFAQRWTTEEVSFNELEEHMFDADYKKYGGMYFLNLYSFRTPDPKILQQNRRVGNEMREETDFHLHDAIQLCKTVVCCWGSWKFINDRVDMVLKMIKEPYCLGVNADGHPKHPLYLAKTTELVKYGL